MPSPEVAFVAQPSVSASNRVIASPFEFYVTGEDALRIVSVCSVAGVHIKLQGRFIDERGTINANAWDHTPNSDRTTVTDDVPIGVGALLNLTVFASAGSPLIGQCFVIVQLVRGTGAAAIVLGTLLQGYVTSRQGLGWPGSPIQASTDGLPPVRVITPLPPNPGQEFTATVPTGARWEIIGVLNRFITSATVIDRFCYLDFNDPIQGDIALCSPAISQQASTNRIQTWAPNLPVASLLSQIIQMPMPNGLFLTAGQFIQSSTPNMQIGDVYTSIHIVVREWLEVN